MNRALNRSRGLSRLTLLLAIAAALPCFAADVYVARDSQGTVVRIYDEPCPVSSGWLVMKRAEMMYQGKLYAACWLVKREIVVLFDEAGNLTAVPTGMFAKEEKI